MKPGGNAPLRKAELQMEDHGDRDAIAIPRHYRRRCGLSDLGHLAYLDREVRKQS